MLGPLLQQVPPMASTTRPAAAFEGHWVPMCVAPKISGLGFRGLGFRQGSASYRFLFAVRLCVWLSCGGTGCCLSDTCFGFGSCLGSSALSGPCTCIMHGFGPVWQLSPNWRVRLAMSLVSCFCSCLFFRRFAYGIERSVCK